jgi:phosphoribosyl 1,2-cyclic phosphodiesterase
MYASDDSMVIIEGADFASALAAFLHINYGFSVVRYDPDVHSFSAFLDRILAASCNPRLLILRAHLTARAFRKISHAEFDEFEQAVSLAGSKLLFALSGEDNPRMAGQIEAYCASKLDKRMQMCTDPFTVNLAWMGINETRRSPLSGSNVFSNAAEL